MISEVRFWIAIGFIGQAVFTARFIVQWMASEREGKSIIPVTFWWLSIVGGMLMFRYAIYREDPVFIVGQALGLIVYVRNLMLVRKNKRASRLKDENVGPQHGNATENAIPRPHLRMFLTRASSGKNPD